MNLGESLKMARKQSGMTQTQLADSLGVSQKDISRWEKGIVTPNTTTFAQICRILHASADEILELK